MKKNKLLIFQQNLRLSFSLFFSVLCLIVILSACKDAAISSGEDTIVVVPENFNFETTHNVDLNLTVKDFSDQTVSGVVWDVYYENPIDTSGLLIESVGKVSTFMTDYNGLGSTSFDVPGHVSQLFLVTSYPGYSSPMIIDANKTPSPINATIYPAGHLGNQLKSAMEDESKFTPSLVSPFPNVYTQSTFNNLGVPSYKEATRDLISKSFKEKITASLPEYSHLPKSANASFLNDAAKANIELVAPCQVWLTFVTEGAGFLNTLGYYYYPTATPPTKLTDIKKAIIAFPNASLLNSGGGLVEGDKVKLHFYDETTKQWTDVFPANYTISWFLFPNGFINYGSKGVINGASKYLPLYSTLSLNSWGFQQNVILFDDTEKKMLISFEDTQRNEAGTAGDEDFNDAVFYATANPIEAIKTDKINKIVAPIDTDKDGVYDVSDEFPTDIKRAFKAYYPAQNTWGTLAYEDMWPQRGDYDFNDVVVDYQTTIVKNASGLVVDVNTDYRFRAAGASYRNAFAVQFNTPTSNIESVTGSNLTSGVFTLNGTKSENGQTQAVVPVTDDITRLFGDSKMVNTVLGSAKLPSVTVPIHVTFKTAINLSTLGAAPYNPFVVVNKVRGIEVHLPGKQPTEFADDKKFGTGIDLTSFNNQLFYVAKASYPWALHIPVQFEYPIEQKAIDKVFYNFGKWVTSGGALYPAWYQNSNANADQTLIYK
jgi:LruC domain-containing protein